MRVLTANDFNHVQMAEEKESKLIKGLLYALKGKGIQVISDPELECVGRFLTRTVSYNPLKLQKAFLKQQLTLLEILVHESIHAMQHHGRYLDQEEKWDQEAFSDYMGSGREKLDQTTNIWMLEKGKDILSHYNLNYSISIRKEMEAWAYSRLVVNYLSNQRSYKDPIIGFICDKLYLLR